MYYQVEQMDGYTRIGSPENVFCYLVEGTEKAMLIDTGYGYGTIRELVKSITSLPLIIINTHGHCDHVGGNAQFEETCYIHEKDMELCRQHTSPGMRREDALRMRHSIDYESGKEFNALPENFDLEAYTALGSGKLETVAEGDEFDLGSATMQIVETPGHTAGGISVLYKEKRLMFLGDATGFFVWLHLEESSGKESYLRMLERLGQMPADLFVGGHNPNVMTKEDFALYQKAAESAVYENGFPFESFLGQENKPMVCPLPGQTMEDMFRPGFASVVIGKDWDNC